jgi:hypothetical protein
MSISCPERHQLGEPLVGTKRRLLAAREGRNGVTLLTVATKELRPEPAADSLVLIAEATIFQ